MATGDNHQQTATMDYAKHIWSMLDTLADDDPDAYRKFIKTQLTEGREASALPQAHMCVRMSIIVSCVCFTVLCSYPCLWWWHGWHGMHSMFKQKVYDSHD
jgi:hypothetical protein